MTSPWDPQWRPDPTGQRLAIIRASRRGAVLAALLFGPVVWAATLVTPPEGLGAPDGGGLWVSVLSLPGLALLGAALTPAVLASRASAGSAGLAMALGAPVASVASAMIAAWFLAAILEGIDRAGEVAGLVLRDGVSGAVMVAPLIALAATAWVLIVRRLVPVRA